MNDLSKEAMSIVKGLTPKPVFKVTQAKYNALEETFKAEVSARKNLIKIIKAQKSENERLRRELADIKEARGY